ncbi:esterase-like activity of phytase family protein [Psychromonas sp. KJ10-10]|uniref:esterase-like activity of phytase family protein n=1 Tax=Psychromonas sp. KJ10-10 TaxID=3391823 RepID=UPI0039B3A742
MLLKKSLSITLIACASATSMVNANSLNIDKIDKSQGALLPYTVLRSDLKDNAKAEGMLEIRNGGFGSDMTAHPTNKNQFYALTDRGPNAGYNIGELGKGKMFPTPEYTPRIGLFEVGETGKINLLKNILLKRPDGSPISGLPNSSALGGTGETPYNHLGQPIVEDMAQGYDANTNPIKLDDFGLDGEGLVAMNDGTFWVSDEYGPHMVHFDSQGKEIGRINAFAHDKRTQVNLPAEFANRRANRGMEGLAITPDQKTLVGIMQSTMYNPSSAVKNLNLVRIVTVDLQTNEVSQYLYQQEKNQNSNSGIASLSDSEFLVIERDGKFLRDDKKAMKHIYRIDMSKATNIESIEAKGALTQDAKLGLLINGETLEQAVLNHGWQILEENNIKPVSKSLVVDLVKTVNYPHDKLEGMWIISPTQFAVVNDDDFATWSSKGKLEQKYLDKAQTEIDGSRLYIIDDVKLD